METTEQFAREYQKNMRFQNENTFVRAQFAGVISAKNFEDGEMYAGAPILQLTQISRLKAIINIPETYFPLVKNGMKVDIFSDIYPDQVFPATIEIVYPTVDPQSHTFQAKLNIPNPGEKIRPGRYVRTHLGVGEVDAAAEAHDVDVGTGTLEEVVPHHAAHGPVWDMQRW